jgi:hypothetical protein
MILDLPSRGPVLLDDADAAIVAPYRWYAAQQPSGIIYARGERHRGDPRVYMHRLLTCADPLLVVDHTDGDGLHNCRTGESCAPWSPCHGVGNLRKTTVAMNNRNVRKRPSSNQYKGVHSSPSGRWYAEISVGGRRYQDRGHDTEVAAARAYDHLAILHHGEFARLNFPADGGPPMHVRELAILDAKLRAGDGVVVPFRHDAALPSPPLSDLAEAA